MFASGRILQLENFRVLRGFGCPGFRGFRTWRQDKGHAACVQAFLRAVESGAPSPIPAEEIFEVSRVAIDVAEGFSWPLMGKEETSALGDLPSRPLAGGGTQKCLEELSVGRLRGRSDETIVSSSLSADSQPALHPSAEGC